MVQKGFLGRYSAIQQRPGINGVDVRKAGPIPKEFRHEIPARDPPRANMLAKERVSYATKFATDFLNQKRRMEKADENAENLRTLLGLRNNLVETEPDGPKTVYNVRLVNPNPGRLAPTIVNDGPSVPPPPPPPPPPPRPVQNVVEINPAVPNSIQTTSGSAATQAALASTSAGPPAPGAHQPVPPPNLPSIVNNYIRQGDQHFHHLAQSHTTQQQFVSAPQYVDARQNNAYVQQLWADQSTHQHSLTQVALNHQSLALSQTNVDVTANIDQRRFNQNNFNQLQQHAHLHGHLHGHYHPGGHNGGGGWGGGWGGGGGPGGGGGGGGGGGYGTWATVAGSGGRLAGPAPMLGIQGPGTLLIGPPLEEENSPPGSPTTSPRAPKRKRRNSSSALVGIGGPSGVNGPLGRQNGRRGSQ